MSFSTADGYCRSEAVVAIFIQKADVVKRNYATILETGSNSDGSKAEGEKAISLHPLSLSPWTYRPRLKLLGDGARLIWCYNVLEYPYLKLYYYHNAQRNI